MRVICVSGYFDPLHVGHLEYIARAKALGDYLVVIVNSDAQARLKKGRSFMPEAERVRVLEALKDVDEVILSVDTDRTVCSTLRLLSTTERKPYAFCNGGDQTADAIPEAPVCEELGIALVDGLGEKIQSSSWLVGAAARKAEEEGRGGKDGGGAGNAESGDVMDA